MIDDEKCPRGLRYDEHEESCDAKLERCRYCGGVIDATHVYASSCIDRLREENERLKIAENERNIGIVVPRQMYDEARAEAAKWKERADQVAVTGQGLRSRLAEAEQIERSDGEIRRMLDTKLAEAEAALARKEAECAGLRGALEELVRAASDTANEHGCSGDLGARLSDARAALASGESTEGR